MKIPRSAYILFIYSLVNHDPRVRIYMLSIDFFKKKLHVRYKHIDLFKNRSDRNTNCVMGLNRHQANYIKATVNIIGINKLTNHSILSIFYLRKTTIIKLYFIVIMCNSTV